MVAHRLNPFQNDNCGDANMKSATILARPMVTQLACTVSIALNAAQALAFNIFPLAPGDAQKMGQQNSGNSRMGNVEFDSDPQPATRIQICPPPTLIQAR